jgi:hypothetical protein
VTSGLPDDSREADERATERRLRDLRGSVKAARAALSANPRAMETLRADCRREAAFYARFGISSDQFQDGVSALERNVGGEHGPPGRLLEDSPNECSPPQIGLRRRVGTCRTRALYIVEA